MFFPSFLRSSEFRGKWFESEIGRAVKVGSQRMKIRSIGSDPNKSKNDGNIKSKLLVEDVKQQPQPGLGAFFGGGGVGGGGGFNFNAFAATVQSAAGDGSVKSILQPQPQPQPPSAPSSGGGGGFAIDQDGTLCGGTNALSQLMSAMGASLGKAFSSLCFSFSLSNNKKQVFFVSFFFCELIPITHTYKKSS